MMSSNNHGIIRNAHTFPSAFKIRMICFWRFTTASFAAHPYILAAWMDSQLQVDAFRRSRISSSSSFEATHKAARYFTARLKNSSTPSHGHVYGWLAARPSRPISDDPISGQSPGQVPSANDKCFGAISVTAVRWRFIPKDTSSVESCHYWLDSINNALR